MHPEETHKITEFKQTCEEGYFIIQILSQLHRGSDYMIYDLLKNIKQTNSPVCSSSFNEPV